jgi:hypothetical protein
MVSVRQRVTRRSVSRKPEHASQVTPSRAHRSGPAVSVHDFQRRAGNQATMRWLRARGVQRALTVGRADDAYEREADRVADAVLRMPQASGPAFIDSAPFKIRRMCAECREEERIQAKSSDAHELLAVTPDLESYLTTSRDGGQPLPVSARDYFEPRFGRDFGGVRVHTDVRAADAASEISAQAFTVGADIYFAPGRLSPGSSSGDRLLAHELTHVVQQSRTDAGGALQRLGIQRQPTPPGPPDPPDPPDFGCSADLAAGKFQDFVNCCAKTPLGRGCSKDVIDGICKIPGVNCGDKPEEKNTCPPGFKPGATKEHKGECCKAGAVAEDARVCCAAPQIAVNALSPRCCPQGSTPDAALKTCVTITPPPPPNICLPGQKTTTGECCILPLEPRGATCVLPTPPSPPPKPLPSPLEIFFQKDKPSAKAFSSAALGDNLTVEGNANFRELVAQLKGNPALKVQLVGKASPEGPEPYNLDLGKRRAELIADALLGEGIDSSRIANPPNNDLRAECKPVRPGIFTCGEAGASGPTDRQVLSRIFQPNP